MKSFKGYVLQSELSTKAKVSNSLFAQLNLKRQKMGFYSCLLKESLPLKYREIAEKECLDLEEYCSYTLLSTELGMCEDYIAVMERYKPFEHKKIGGAKLFKLSTEFIKNINKGLIPFKIKDNEDEKYAEKIIQMQGIKIGFY
jgi:hypothetical protein